MQEYQTTLRLNPNLYDAHMNEFTTPPSVTLREIQVGVQTDARGVNVAAEEAAKTRIEELRARVTAGLGAIRTSRWAFDASCWRNFISAAMPVLSINCTPERSRKQSPGRAVR